MKRLIEKRRLLLTVTICCLCIASSFAQYNRQSLDSLQRELLNCRSEKEKVDILNALADEYYRTVDKNSYVYAVKAKELAESINYTRGLGYAFHRLGRLAHIEYNFDEALSCYIKAVKKAQRINDRFLLSIAYNSIGLLHKNFDDGDRAMAYFDKGRILCLEIGNYKTLADIYLNLGRLSYDKLDLKEGENYSNKAMRLAEKLKDPHLLAEAYHNMARRLSNSDARSAGVEYLHKAENIVLENFGFDHPLLGNIYSYLGQVSQDPFKAEAYLLKALEYGKRFYQSDHIEIMLVHLYLGRTYQQTEHYDSALNHLELALSICKEIMSDCHYYFNQVEYLIGKTYYYMGRLSKAEDSFSNVIECDNRIVAAALLCMGDVHLKRLDYSSALSYYQKTISFSTGGFNNENFYINPPLNAFSSTDRLALSALLGKARAFKEVYLQEAFDINNLKAAWEAIFLCDSLNRRIRESLIRQDDLLWIGDQNQEIYRQAVEIGFLLSSHTKDGDYIAESFYFSEKGRANILHEAFYEANARKVAGIPDSMVAREEKIRGELNYCQSRRLASISSNDSVGAVKWRKKIVERKVAQQKLIHSIRVNYPEYFQLKYELNIPSVSEVQATLQEDQGLIEYLESDGSFFAFVLTKDSFEAVSLPEFDHNAVIRQFSKGIIKEQKNAYVKNAHILYLELIRPVEELLGRQKRLIIIPDGLLWQVNFDLALRSEKGIEDYRLMDYLCKEYAISYAYSATILTQIHQAQKNKAERKVLAFSYNDSDPGKGSFSLNLRTLRDSKTEIPGTSKEIKAISAFVDGDYYYGDMARESVFKEKAARFSLLHLALHGEVDADQPDFTRLHFRPSSEIIDDGRLHAFELYNLSLQAELAVLSACNTGSGKMVDGEGIMSLGRAFSYAGVQSLMLSMWKVSDAAAPEIMKGFYKELGEGATKDEALRQAKLSYLSNSNSLSSAPFYWGAFYILGDTEAIRFSAADNNIPIGLAAVILILIIGIAAVVRYKSSVSR